MVDKEKKDKKNGEEIDEVEGLQECKYQ